MNIRRAHPEDVEAVRQIVQAAYGHYVARLGKPPGPMLDDYRQRVADAQAWVLEDEGGPAGVLILEDGDGGLLLDNLAVSPAAQGRGYGRALIAFAEQEARRRGHAAIRLYTNALMTENLALYGRLGFRRTGHVAEKGYERVYMAKALP